MFSSKIGATFRLVRGGCKLVATQSDRAAGLVWFYVLKVSQGVTKTAVVCHFPLKLLMSKQSSRIDVRGLYALSLDCVPALRRCLVVLLVNETIR